MKKTDIIDFEDQIIFIIEHIIDALTKNHLLLKFISKNLSLGIYNEAVNKIADLPYDDGSIFSIFMNGIQKNNIKLKCPEATLFMIIELASSTSYSTILDNDPMSFEELKPYLNESIRAIIRNHIIKDTAEN